MSHDPLRDAFERMAPRQVSPIEARDRLGALSPGFRSARRNHRIRTGVAGVTAVVALMVGGPFAIAAIAPGSSAPTVDFASPDDGADESTDQDVVDEPSTEDAPGTDTSSTTEEAPDGATETTDSSDEDDDVSDDAESIEHDAAVLGEGSSDDDSDADSDDASSTGSDDDSDDSDESDDQDESDDDDDDDDAPDDGEDVVDGQIYTMGGVGGTLSVRVVDGEIEYVDDAPAAGFEVDLKDSPDEVRADFYNGTDRYRVEAEYEHGQLFWTIEELD